jgi:hypothetical protein
MIKHDQVSFPDCATVLEKSLIMQRMSYGRQMEKHVRFVERIPFGGAIFVVNICVRHSNKNGMDLSAPLHFIPMNSLDMRGVM